MSLLTGQIKGKREAAHAWSRAARDYNRSLRQLGNNDEESFRRNVLAAESGMHDAVLAMGWFYRNGIGVPQDNEQAFAWWRKAARQGDARAMFSLGQMAYEEKDYSEALVWFTRASEQGHSRSLYWRGKLHWRGHGVPADRKLAMRLFSQAAAKKEQEAQRAIRYISYCQHRH